MYQSRLQKFNTVLSLVDSWNPKLYGHEKHYRDDLRSYLEDNLGDHDVSIEYEKLKGDVTVDDDIGIEVTRDFSGRHSDKLRSQLESYSKEYTYVIACACGLVDYESWSDIRHELGGTIGGKSPEKGSRIWFIEKHPKDD